MKRSRGTAAGGRGPPAIRDGRFAKAPRHQMTMMHNEKDRPKLDMRSSAVSLHACKNKDCGGRAGGGGGGECYVAYTSPRVKAILCEPKWYYLGFWLAKAYERSPLITQQTVGRVCSRVLD